MIDNLNVYIWILVVLMKISYSYLFDSTFNYEIIYEYEDDNCKLIKIYFD